jgi:5'-deoxynucleotidase YfbR-like HD superfamily hydrolase
MTKENKNSEKPKRMFFKPPTTYEEYKAVMNSFAMQVFGSPTSLSDEKIRELWEEYLAKKPKNNKAVRRKKK